MRLLVMGKDSQAYDNFFLNRIYCNVLFQYNKFISCAKKKISHYIFQYSIYYSIIHIILYNWKLAY